MCGKAEDWAEDAEVYNCYYETDGSLMFDPTIFHTDYQMFDITDNILNDMDDTRVYIYAEEEYENCLYDDNTDLENYELGCAYYCRENHALYKEWGFYSPDITTKPTDVTASALCIKYNSDPEDDSITPSYMCVCTETRERDAEIDCETDGDVNCPYTHQLEPVIDDFTD